MLARIWKDTGERASVIGLRSIAQALHDAATLRHLGGAGEGCAGGAGPPSTIRRRFHHLTAYGFALCFAATVVATWYHYVLHWPAPYPLTSLPVVLGVLGGLGLIVGPAGLWWLSRRRDPAFADPAHAPANEAFIVLLFLTSATGLALLVWRESAAMPYLLAVHLGVVLALFVSFAYGKFVHAIHRLAALVRYAVERKRAVRDFGGG
jgi:citrate/tricarballylate utilization protein